MHRRKVEDHRGGRRILVGCVGQGKGRGGGNFWRAGATLVRHVRAIKGKEGHERDAKEVKKNETKEKIDVLADKYYDAGRYSVIFNGAGLSSGIYFVKMSAGQFNHAQKIMLIK